LPRRGQREVLDAHAERLADTGARIVEEQHQRVIEHVHSD
jgi:hypothetical protein